MDLHAHSSREGMLLHTQQAGMESVTLNTVVGADGVDAMA
jgi:hypothetical protein